MPAIVTWLGVMPKRASAPAARCAFRLTHAWKRLVNTLNLRGAHARRLIYLDHPRRDLAPRVLLGLGQRILRQPAAQIGIAGEHRERRAQLDRAARPHGEAVATRLDHGQVAGDL